MPRFVKKVVKKFISDPIHLYNNNLFTGGVTDLLRGRYSYTQVPADRDVNDEKDKSLRRSMTEMRILMLCLISALFITFVILLVLLLRYSRRRERRSEQDTGYSDNARTNQVRF